MPLSSTFVTIILFVYYCAYMQVQDADGVYGVVLVNPSVTTYGHMNPSFRIFSMDKTSLQLRGYEQYHLNITRANGETACMGCPYLIKITSIIGTCMCI